jgi:hypothetical protein
MPTLIWPFQPHTFTILHDHSSPKGYESFKVLILEMSLGGSVENHTSVGETAFVPDHDLLKAALVLQRRYRFTQTLKIACLKRSKRRESGWESVTDGSQYLLEYGKSSAATSG